VDLSPAKAHYQAALQLDPDNAAANRRLGQIELAESQYDSACQHLAHAVAVAPTQRATRQMMGECYAMQGHMSQATALWQTIDNQENQFQTRIWWYDAYLGDRARAMALSQVLQALGQHN
jgi:predicted Zn-dependent protease